MAELVVVRQNIDLETEFRARFEGETGLTPVEDIRDITPYGMLLAGLGSCSAVLVNTYARHHGIPLEESEFSVEYERSFKEDCERCEEAQSFDEQIKMAVRFKGKLDEAQLEKLFKISLQCPVHKLLAGGIKVQSRLEKTKTITTVS